MELTKNFEPQQVEHKWYSHWLEKRYFNSKPDGRKAFTVVIPPPNVTGVLHMGHTLNETVQDILVRKARMSGYNACWVPGSDHASIATEAKVVAMLKEKGIEKSSLSREEFLKYAFEWKDKYGGIIYNQIERLGCSVDWERVSFTMDADYYRSVLMVFEDLYDKGLIYRGARMINWDTAAKTALSDEEVEYKDIEGKLYHIAYPLVDAEGISKGTITIATQRPETIMGDTAVCVNPGDERYGSLKDHYAIIPLINKKVPIIFDEYVDPAFGTGALKVTPAHDINDYNLGLKHNLEVIDALNEDGTISEAAQIYVGEDRFVARKKIIEELTEKGFITKVETYPSRIGYSQRSGSVVEPRISTQWFVKMKELAQPALDAVVSGKIKIHPGERFLATYKYWLENVKDWCISRQLWWGQQIPAWYDKAGNMVVALSRQEALEKLKALNHAVAEEEIVQDNDVLDTWFSSWLWPIEVFKGISNPGNEEIKYYYPTSVLVTGQDIIFFWVARMVMAGMEYMNEIPFSDVYFTGMVRDSQGRKMSKSLGNSPDLLDLIDRFGADAVRFGIMISSPAGNDLLFDESALEQGRNFNNKIWNALKLVKMWEAKVEDLEDTNISASFAINWFDNKLSATRAEVESLMTQFKLSEALKVIYSLVWDDFCSWYLEWVKPGFEQPVSRRVYDKTVEYFTQLMQLLHPYMPFITEEIYHRLKPRETDLAVLQFEERPNADQTLLRQGDLLKLVITSLRDLRNKNQIKPKEPIELFITTNEQDLYKGFNDVLSKQVNAFRIQFTDTPLSNGLHTIIGKDRFGIITEKPMDSAAQQEAMQKEMDYLKGFIAACDKKLDNERFVANAKPEVVELEKKKKNDAMEKLKAISESLGIV